MSVNTRQKGMALSKYVAEQIKERGIDLRAYPRGDSGAGNKDKTDVTTVMQIMGRAAGIECKNTKVASVTPWWKQTKKLESLGYEPLLIYSLAHESFDDAKVVIYLDTFLQMIKATGGGTNEVHFDDNQKSLAIIEAIGVLSKLLAYYGKKTH